MKSSLYLAVIFFISCIFCILVGAFSFMIYNVTINLSAGSEVSFFNIPIFLEGLVFSIPVAAILSCFFIIFYIIRHPSNPWFNLLVYSILGLLVWCVMIPASYKLAEVMLSSKSETTQKEQSETMYTSGYFRKVSNGYVYFTQVHEDNTADGVIIVKGNPSTFTNIPLTSFFDDIYKDILFTSALKPSRFVDFAISFLTLFWEIGKYSYMGKGLYLISYFSFALVLLSVIGLSRCSKWRLCNMCFVFVAFFVLCFINYFIYDSKFFVSVIRFFISKNIEILSDRRILQLIINSFFFLIFSTIGIVNAIIKPEANQELVTE